MLHIVKPFDFCLCLLSLQTFCLLSFVFWLLSLQTLHIVKTFPIFNHSHYNPLSWHGVPILLAKTCFLRPIILWSWSERGMLKIMIHTKECLDWVAPCVFLHSEGPKPTHASTQLIQNRKKMLMRYFFFCQKAETQIRICLAAFFLSKSLSDCTSLVLTQCFNVSGQVLEMEILTSFLFTAFFFKKRLLIFF